MTNSTGLERRYRSLLALYPKAFRREHEQEMLSVLMAAAAHLVRNAIFMRLRQTRVPVSWEYAHVRLMLPVRLVTGVWLVFLTAILYGYGRGGWWGALLVPAATLHFYIAYRLIHRPEQAPDTAPRERL